MFFIRALLKAMPARLLGDEFRFCSWIFSTVQRANWVDRAVGCAVRFVLEKWTDIWQFAARPTVDALAFASFRDGQHGRKGPSDSGTPGIHSSISHVEEHTLTAWKYQAPIREMPKVS